ncbi:Tetratricopeptide repeat superfamily protein [Perilla frutescens var. frutescens]|nr:Tetratricopeptide repeat superfamily protein [Perilla frutescens var. frutescens]
MYALRGIQFQSLQPTKTSFYNIFYLTQSRTYISSSTTFQSHSNSTFLLRLLGKQPKNAIFFRNPSVSLYSSRIYRGPIPRSLRKRINKRARAAAKPVLNEALFQAAISQLPPRFAHEDLHDIISLQDDPLVCFELFNWASQQHRFRHSVLTYHITIKKLGAAKMYEEMDYVVNQVLAVPTYASEPLYNSMIYYFTEARKLVRAVNIYKLMRGCRKLDCRPTIRTYNILFGALLSRGKNSYINHMYMETIRCLFKQMVDDGIEPDIFCLNSMIKGYVLSLHVNDALRIFHQMGVMYECQPNSFSYDYLIHGLCAQGRTNNARELCDTMKKSGFVPSSKSYNSLVNSLALEGEIDEAVKFLWEMAENQRLADVITYRTVLDEMSRQKGTRQALRLLKQLQERKLVDGHTYQKILYELEDNSHNANI